MFTESRLCDFDFIISQKEYIKSTTKISLNIFPSENIKRHERLRYLKI